MIGGYWIGHPGALLCLPDLGTLSRKSDRAVNYKESAGGYRRAYMSARRPVLREWSVSLTRLTPPEAAALNDLLSYTDPPYTWVDPWARVTNLLPPRPRMLPDLPLAGRQPLAGGGFSPAAMVNPTLAVVRIEPAPVVPDQPVTVSAFLASAGAAKCRAVFLDSAGRQVGATYDSVPVTGTDALRRASVTVAAPPPTAAAVTVHCINASVIGQPTVTWTPAAFEYGAGGGAAQVVVSGLDESILSAHLKVDQLRRLSPSFTVTEVG